MFFVDLQCIQGINKILRHRRVIITGSLGERPWLRISTWMILDRLPDREPVRQGCRGYQTDQDKNDGRIIVLVLCSLRADIHFMAKFFFSRCRVRVLC